MDWRYPFTALYILAAGAFCLWLYRWNVRRARRRDAEAMAERAAMAEVIAMQERIDARARALLALADTLPPMPTLSASLPTVLPASYLDYSDNSDDTIIYCPICALEGIRVSGLRDADGYYPLPRGKRALCSEHTVRWERRIEGDIL